MGRILVSFMTAKAFENSAYGVGRKGKPETGWGLQGLPIATLEERL